MGDLRDLKALEDKLQAIVDYKNKIFMALYNAGSIGADEIFEKCKIYAERLY